MSGHSDRKHAVLSASGAHRWLNCTPSAQLEARFPDQPSEAAREGTLAHEIAERKLFGRRWDDLRENKLYKDEMDGYTDVYVEEIDRLAMAYEHEPQRRVEVKLDLHDWVPGGFGTADCILFGGDTLTVIDLKYGKGVKVEAEKNPQMMLYALGAVGLYGPIYGIRKVRMKIIQPRIDNMPEYEISTDYLLDWGDDVRRIALVAIQGKGDYKPGDWCRFCRAQQQCRAYADDSVKLAFAADKKPPLITDAEVGEYLKQGEHVQQWLNGLREYALGACLSGHEIPGWKAVEGRSIRAFDDTDAAFRDLEAAGVEDTMLYERRPLTLAKIEKLLGKKKFAEIAGDHVIKPAGKPTLVDASDSRPAITTSSLNDIFA